MKKKRIDYDELLHIQTRGRDDEKADAFHHPYEPTPYRVLERLADCGLIQKEDVLIDFGCGKGRVDFFMNKICHCKTIGVEYDERMYDLAIKNAKGANNQDVSFCLQQAENYEIPQTSNRFYFFNPFSIEILYTVLDHILASYYEHPRTLYLFFYYPSDDYIAHLMMHDGFTFYDEIECGDLFEGNNIRERIMIFTIDC